MQKPGTSRRKQELEAKRWPLKKDALLKSPKFDALKEYERFEDIHEAYGWDAITEKQRDDLEALWEERENIKNHVDNGVYKDDVTEALMQAWIFIQDMWHEEIEEAESMRKEFNKQKQEAEIAASEGVDRQNAEYNRIMRGKNVSRQQEYKNQNTLYKNHPGRI